MHPPIGHDLPYRLMNVDWHRLAEMVAIRHCHKQQCEAARRHPLSLVDSIKIYFINNTCYFNARRNYVNKIYEVQPSTILEAIFAILGSWGSAL
jgi:hypothetical protein